MTVQEDLFSKDSQFAVNLDVFSGPFEVLLSLIARHRLDITEVALAQVTDEFLAFVRAQDEMDLSLASEFLVVAATLLDLKAARLLPRTEEDEEDLELLEARDLLFAKLLQYRAFKDVAADIAIRLSQESMAAPRDVPMEPQFAKLLPEVELGLDAEGLAILAVRAMSRPEETLSLSHLHDPLVPVETQVAIILERMVVGDRLSFTALCRDARNVATVVSRFLAVLELMRNGHLSVEQDGPLAPLVLIRTEAAQTTSDSTEADYE